jgi:hypothetical protein
MSKPFLTYIILLLLFTNITGISAQDITGKNYPFKDGEMLKYKVYYNWGPVWIDAGRITFSTAITKYDNNDVFHFEATGNSLKKWNWFFKLEDYYQSYARKSVLSPLYYEKYTVEGGYMMHNRYFFDYGNKTVRMITEASRKPKKDTVAAISGCIYDPVTAINYFRTLNTGKLSTGDTVQIPVVLNGKIFTQKLIYTGKVNITNNKKEFSLIEFEAVLSESSFFSNDNAIHIYLSDDEEHYPVFITAKIVIGYIKVYLNRFTDIDID